jgi:hypothetical protein
MIANAHRGDNARSIITSTRRSSCIIPYPGSSSGFQVLTPLGGVEQWILLIREDLEAPHEKANARIDGLKLSSVPIYHLLHIRFGCLQVQPNILPYILWHFAVGWSVRCDLTRGVLAEIHAVHRNTPNAIALVLILDWRQRHAVMV